MTCTYNPCDGLHFLANLYNCTECIHYLDNAPKLQQYCLAAVSKSKLTALGQLFHQFDNGGVTGTVVLAESHLAIHTWPESRTVTLDVYVSNYTKNNSHSARMLVDDLIHFFKPIDTTRHTIERNISFVSEMLSKDYGFILRSEKQLASFRTDFQSLEVHDTPQFGRVLRLGDHFQTSEKEEYFYHENLIHPALTTLKNPKRVLIIGGGDGGSAEEVIKHPSIEQVILVEIDCKVVEIAKEFFATIHNNVFNDPRFKLLIEDGFDFIVKNETHFDCIVLDIPDPIGSAQKLYEEEFLYHCKRSLVYGGILTLHLGAPIVNPSQAKLIYRYLKPIFSVVKLYTVFVPLYGNLWLMAACSDSFDPTSLSETEIDKRIQEREINDLQYYNGATHHGIFSLPNFLRNLIE